MAKIENGVECSVYWHADIFPSVASHDVWQLMILSQF